MGSPDNANCHSGSLGSIPPCLYRISHCNSFAIYVLNTSESTGTPRAKPCRSQAQSMQLMLQYFIPVQTNAKLWTINLVEDTRGNVLSDPLIDYGVVWKANSAEAMPDQGYVGRSACGEWPYFDLIGFLKVFWLPWGRLQSPCLQGEGWTHETKKDTNAE